MGAGSGRFVHVDQVAAHTPAAVARMSPQLRLDYLLMQA